jgi:two-component system CheB/CheR fusion protein
VTVTTDTVDGCARVRVKDTGAGIDPAFLPRVFNRFSQGDSSNTRPHGGLGLGLAIVRHLVEQHRGSVQAESTGAGAGATFTVILPIMKLRRDTTDGGGLFAPAALTSAGSGRGDGRMKDLRVLVVDDDLATADAVAEMLTGLGAEVKIAESAAIAMTIVEEFRPKVLLCDIAMPGEDGYSFIHRLRALGQNSGGDTPALALTALAAEDDQRRSLAAGFQMHLTKPVDIQRLSDAVVELAERRQAG